MMKKHFHITALLIIVMSLFAASSLAQDATPGSALPPQDNTDPSAAGETTEVVEDVPAGQEVEINEDNYRQFMELKDARMQRDILPETSYQSQAGLQKLDKLPEESQKHLRDELREIILEGDEWQPGDEAADYPYVPSMAAATNPELQKQEAEAWGELVDNYNEREARIYQNRSRVQAASAAASAAAGNGEQGEDGGGAGQAGANQQQSDQDQQAGKPGAAGSYSPQMQQDQNTNSTAGVSQNAMEFLSRMQNQAGSQGSGQQPTAGESSQAQPGAQAQQQAQSGANAQSQGQPQSGSTGEAASEAQGEAESEAQDQAASEAQGEAESEAQDQAASEAQGEAESEDQGEATSEDQGEATSEAQGEADSEAQDQQPSDEADRTPDEIPAVTPADTSETESTSGVSQNALQYLMGEQATTTPATEQGTLSIEDLMNAQGIGNVPGDGERQNDENKTDPDGGH